MPNELPHLGADIILEFQQSINNIRLFGEAMEGLDSRFASMERRIESMRSSLSGLSSQVSKGSGRNLRAEIERELNDLILGNGIVVSKVGTAPLKVDAKTVRSVFSKVESEINMKLAEAYKNIIIQVDPSLQVGKIPISKDDFEEVNKAIAKLVKVQLNNLVAALRKHGAGLISAQDLAAVQFQIGRGTVQQIINKVKDHLKGILLNPNFSSGNQLEFTERDMNRIYSAIRSKVRESIQNTIEQVSSQREITNFADNIQRLHNAVDESARDYIRNVTQGIQSISTLSMTRPLDQLSNQLRRFMAKELGTDLDTFNKAFANHRFTNADIHSAELRRQFSRLENELNRKIGGGLQDEVKEIIKQIQGVQISYSPKLRYHLVQEINRINNQIVKKIREQIDLQFANMMAEIDSVRVAPKDINRSRRIRELGRVEYDEAVDTRRTRQSVPLANDPYARRDAYFNSFGLEGAVINTVRHILAGSIVGTPMMLMYRSIETFGTSQLEQLKMYSNLYSKAQADAQTMAAQGDNRTPSEYASQTIQEIMPFVKEASQFYAISYDLMSEIASVGSRLLETPTEIKAFTDIVGKIYNIDREGNPVESIAPGLEAFMGQFDLAVGELEKRVAIPLDIATNLTNATTEAVMKALMRSGSVFRAAGISPEDAIAMVATSIKYTGLSGENIGNFYKSVLPRLQSKSSLNELEKIGINVYYTDENGVERARDAMEIMKDVADKFNKLTDRSSRDLVMDLFGTYQSAKGRTTLDELFEAVRISDAIKSSQDDPTAFYDKMMANRMSPIIQMQRSGQSVTLALTSILEELSPEIVDVAQAITNLSTGIREHKEALAGFIQFLGNALLGFATVYGMRWIGNKAGVPGAMQRVETADKVLGNPGVFGRGVSQGALQNFTGTINPMAIANSSANRAFINKALTNDALAPVIRDLANMSENQIKTMQAYIKDNNIRVKDMKDLILTAQESLGYTPKRQLTADERWGSSQHMASRLYASGMQGINGDFVQQLASDLQDRQKFDQLSKTKQGRKVTEFLAGLDENEMKKFQAHIEELHKSTGRVVDDMGSLTHAVNTYVGVQAKNREELRRTNPQFVALSNNIDKVTQSLNSSRFLSGMRNFDTFVGSIGQKARGAVTALGGLARSLAGFGAQMILFAGVGEFVSSIGSQGIYTNEQIEVKRNEKIVQDINELKNRTRIGAGQPLMLAWDRMMSIWDAVTSPGTDKYTDLTDLNKVAVDFAKFLNETKGAKLNTSDRGSILIGSITDFINSRGLDRDKVFSEFMNWGDESVQKNLKDARMVQFKADYERIALDEKERQALEDQMRGKVNERISKDLQEGNYRIYDLQTVKQDLADQISKINAKGQLDQLGLLMDGYSSDSEEFIRVRREQSQQIIKLYEEELDGINRFIERLKAGIETMRREGASEEDIKKEQDLLNQWEGYRQEAEREFGSAAMQERLNLSQAEFDASLSRIQKAASLSENRRVQQEALNSLTMDRNSREYIDASVGIANSRINDLNSQIEQLKSAAITGDQMEEVEQQIAQLRTQIAQERVRIKELQLSGIGAYRQDLNDRLAEMSNEYLQARVNSGIADENSPYLRNFRINQYEKQVSMFNSIIEDLKNRLDSTTDVEGQKQIQREIRDLQRQSLQAQLGILEEMKNTGGTFNLPDNVRAMSYYEYITRNNTHSTYTVQEGDTNITITLPNITDSTSLDRVRQIGKAIGEGVNQGKSLRLQKQANPFGYRG